MNIKRVLIASLLVFSPLVLAATSEITGRQIKDLTITNADISDNTISPFKLSSDNAPADEYCLTFESDNNFEWQSCSGGGGGGDVVGPASATDDAIARFDGTTGKLIKNSSVRITNGGDLIFDTGADQIFANTTGPTGYFGVSSTYSHIGLSSAGFASDLGQFEITSGFGTMYGGSLRVDGLSKGLILNSGDNGLPSLIDNGDATDGATYTGDLRIVGTLTQETTLFEDGDDSIAITDTFSVKTAVSGGGDTMTLPDCAGEATYDGARITIKDGGGAGVVDTITIDSAGGNIDGGATKVIITAYGHVTVFCANAQWYVESESL